MILNPYSLEYLIHALKKNFQDTFNYQNIQKKYFNIK